MASAFYLLFGCMQIQLAICSGSSSNVYLLGVEDRGQFSPLFWLIPPICHQIVSPPRHLSSLLYKLIGIVTLLVAHITFLPPPTRVYLLRSSDVCRPATAQSARHHNQTYFPQKERNVPTINHSVLIWSYDVWSPVRTSEHCPGLLVLHLASITKLFLGCRK